MTISILQFLTPYLATGSALADALQNGALGEHTQTVLDSLSEGAIELGKPELRDLVAGLKNTGPIDRPPLTAQIGNLVRSADGSLLGRIVANRLLQGTDVAVEHLREFMKKGNEGKREKLALMLKEGQRLEGEGRLSEAYKIYSSIMREDAETEHPDIHVIALFNMSGINFQGNNFMHAAYALKRVLTLNPDHLNARWQYVQALNALKQTMAAIHQIDLVLLKVESLKEILKNSGKPTEALSPKNQAGMERVETIGKEAEAKLKDILNEAIRANQYPSALFALEILIKHTEDKNDLLIMQKRLHQEAELKSIKPKQPEEFNRRDLVELSKILGHALRHAPWEYELELDVEGWAYLDSLIESLRFKPKWALMTRDILEKTVETVSQGRYEIKGDLIRALYGHSEIVPPISKEKSDPPEILYHGTDESFLPYIFQTGLQRGTRQYVHLSSTPERALQIASRKGNKPVLLVIRTEEMLKKGFSFYRGSEQIWLVNEVPTDFFDINSGIN